MCVYIFRFVELPELYEGTGWGSMQPRDSRLATPNSVLGTPRIGGPGGMTPSVAGTPMSVAGSVAGSTFTASSTPLRLVYYVTARMYSHKNTKLFFLSNSFMIYLQQIGLGPRRTKGANCFTFLLKTWLFLGAKKSILKIFGALSSPSGEP